MNVSGEHRVAAAREQVWRALHDTDTLHRCLPGCEDVRALDPSHFSGRLTAKVGPVNAVFSGQMTVADEHFPKEWQLVGHAESPSAGWADGTASIRLAAVPGGTVVSYRLHLDPGGRLAAVGDHLLRGVAMRTAEDFFSRLTERLVPEVPRPMPPSPKARAPEPLDAGGSSRAQYIIIAIGAIFCAFILLSMALALLGHR